MITLNTDKVKLNGISYVWFYLIILFLNYSFSTRNDINIIRIPKEATFQQKLAAQEIRRYLYARTGKLLRIDTISSNSISIENAIIITESGHYFIRT